ncbi:MAG: putative Diguanylate kinase [Blastococcus sp.]|jgi:diguanylate cyclase (GGDEF)-like protein/PAS domain S-box-containing protein|nr:putative Diguanylate kinase [Blastococcus sp.]
MTSSAPTSRAAWLHAALVVLLVAAVVTVVPPGPWRPAAELVVLGLGIAGVRCALQRHRTPLVIAWRGLGLGLLLFAVSGTAEVAQLAGVLSRPSAVLESGFDIAAYAALVVGALGVVERGGRRRDRAAWTDTATLLLAAGLGLLAVVGHGGRILTGTALRESAVDVDLLPLLAVAAVVLAGRHPAVATMGRRPDAAPERASTRILGLGAALLIGPALLILWPLGHGGIGYVLGAGSALLTGMALCRLMALDRERERASTALAASEARLQLLLEYAADVIAIVDADGSVAYMSPAVQSLLGRAPTEYVGRNAIELADPRDQPRLRAAVAAAGGASSAAVGFVDTDIRVQHSSGGTRWVEMRISGRVDAVGIRGWVVNFREVTDRKLFEDELRRQATTDPLTGLLNRTAFSDRLTAATVRIDPSAPPAVLFVDIDDFKAVNDTLGHAAGDELLTTVAARLSADVRADDVVARLGGDEFAVLLTFADGERLRDVADRLLASLSSPIEIAGAKVVVTASIGGALGCPGDTAERLLHSADTAMYSVKRSGKNSHELLGTPAV